MPLLIVVRPDSELTVNRSQLVPPAPKSPLRQVSPVAESTENVSTGEEPPVVMTSFCAPAVVDPASVMLALAVTLPRMVVLPLVESTTNCSTGLASLPSVTTNLCGDVVLISVMIASSESLNLRMSPSPTAPEKSPVLTSSSVPLGQRVLK